MNLEQAVWGLIAFLGFWLLLPLWLRETSAMIAKAIYVEKEQHFIRLHEKMCSFTPTPEEESA